nr:immunoglobulin light chain junction region [Macaca mulatta]MOW36124.1 immunoglobulin light chain junction region [Macaca mulatta]MOW36276.1 immunoglobulin light chain junction region [Macaca mulatta]MOW36380.1 immunoglobulin light chain junction region [Macaca mulatta]MOW36469.1 immunoglobulin light chain junction region [Macaca mulatta]
DFYCMIWHNKAGLF